MDSELPKVLHPLLGKPLLSYVIDNIKSSGINDITVVVGYKGEEIEKMLDDDITVVWQREQLGTGHAVLQAKEQLKGFDGSVLVAYGDAPLISGESFSKLIAEREKDNVKASVLTMIQGNPFGYGRMVKDSSENLSYIVEEKDANDEERAVKEVNTGTYIFDSKLLEEGLDQMKNDNAQGEYYLTDVIGYIISKGFSVSTMPLEDEFEGNGINSKEELEKIEKYLLANKEFVRK
jgi:bifunctional UDP-N-acetylglucosamine pyrophosphorylase/glucosamine-1-phosphate N-acetyltransferase